MHTIKKLFWLIIFLIVIIFMSVLSTNNSSNTKNDRANMIEFARNSDLILEQNKISLVNGRGELKLPIDISTDSKITFKVNYFGNEAYGDINDDGRNDLAFLVSEDTGGSGLFYYVIVALNNTENNSITNLEGEAKRDSSKYVMTNANSIGDRIAPQSMSITDGKLYVNFADRKSGEAMTVMPSIGITKIFTVNKDGVLEEILGK